MGALASFLFAPHSFLKGIFMMHEYDRFQNQVWRWMLACFGIKITEDTKERNHRFIEEAIELVQACGCSKEDCLMLVDYVYRRPLGEKSQEVGGVMVTLAALCIAQKIDMEKCGFIELERIWGKIEQIREKQAKKPGNNSPLPEEPFEPIHCLRHLFSPEGNVL